MSLVMTVGANLYAVPVAAVHEVLPALPIETVPRCPAFIRGVVLVRGVLIPVLDAAERLGIAGHQRPLEPPIVCLRSAGRVLGLEVDDAQDLIELDCSIHLAASEAGGTQGFFAGVAAWKGELIRLLDPDKLLAPEELSVAEALPSRT